MKRQVRSVLLGLPVVAMLAVTWAAPTPVLADSRHRDWDGYGHHTPFWDNDHFEDHHFHERRWRGGRSYHDRDHDDDLELGAAIGALGALGVAGAILSAPPPPQSGTIVWNNASGYGVREQPLSLCQTIVRDGIAERFGTLSVQFSGGADAGTAFAVGRTFNFRCTG